MYEEAWNAMLKRICLVMALAAAYAALLVLAAAVGLRIASLAAAGTDPAPSDIPDPVISNHCHLYFESAQP